MNIKDLQIEKEIIPLFDFTLNEFAKSALLEIFSAQLTTEEEIYNQQNIYKGFTFNHTILANYKYPVSYIHEVYYFLETFNFDEIPRSQLKYRFVTPSTEKLRLQNKLSQLILLFSKLHSDYFSRLKLSSFPSGYQKSIDAINSFFTNLDIRFYSSKIREGTFSTTHILALVQKIQLLKSNYQIPVFWNNLFLFEAYLSINKAIISNGFVFPEISKNTLELKNMYYPLLKNPVRNDFATSSNVVILTGPNMSGKSTFLKAISLCTYLAQLGIAIPASNAKLPIFSTVSVSINHTDDIKSGYSHFMTELISLKNVASTVVNGAYCFAAFDELFSGTSAEDALEILVDTINGLSKFNNSLVIISTHIPQIKEAIKISSKKIEAYYIDCQLVDSQPKFTYQIKPGWSELRIGQLLFNNIGLNKILA